MRAGHAFPRRRDFDKKYHKWPLWEVLLNSKFEVRDDGIMVLNPSARLERSYECISQ